MVVDESPHRIWVLLLRLWRRFPWPAGRGRDRAKVALTRSVRPPRAVPTRAGRLALEQGEDSLERHLLATGTHWETEVVALLEADHRRLRGATVVDVGGHVGFYALLLADLVGPDGHVVAVEAHEDLCERIRWSAERNRRPWLQVVHGAATDHDGPVSLVADPDRGHTTAIAVQGARFTAPGVRLDDLLARPGLADPDLVMMDIEGGEAAALRGAEATLRRARPDLLVEVHPAQLAALGADQDALVAWIREDLGYLCWEVDHRAGVRPLATPPTISSWHLLARAREP